MMQSMRKIWKQLSFSGYLLRYSLVLLSALLGLYLPLGQWKSIIYLNYFPLQNKHCLASVETVNNNRLEIPVVMLIGFSSHSSESFFKLLHVGIYSSLRKEAAFEHKIRLTKSLSQGSCWVMCSLLKGHSRKQMMRLRSFNYYHNKVLKKDCWNQTTCF